MAKYDFSLVPDVFKYECHAPLESDAKRAASGKAPKPPTLKRLPKLGLTEDFDGAKSRSTGKDNISPPWGLLPGYVEALNNEDEHGARHKVIFVIRHGYSLHNYVEKEVNKGTDNWSEGVKVAYKKNISLKALEGTGCKIPQDLLKDYLQEDRADPTAVKLSHHDAPLLPKSIAQELRGPEAGNNDVGDLGTEWLNWVNNDAFPLPDAVYTSPLRRCLKTTEKVYAGVFEAHAEKCHSFHPVVKENARERLNGHACNYRGSKSDIEANFPNFKFEPDFPEKDPFEDDIVKGEKGEEAALESDEKHQDRMRLLLNDIFDDDKTNIVSLTTHSFSIGALTRVIGRPYTLNEGDITAFFVKAIPIAPGKASDIDWQDIGESHGISMNVDTNIPQRTTVEC